MDLRLLIKGIKFKEYRYGLSCNEYSVKKKRQWLYFSPDVVRVQMVKKSGKTLSDCKIRIKELIEREAWLTYFFKQDIANLSIHLRIREKMNQVNVHRELILESKNYVIVSHQICS